jgi:CO/xanthine dehydrogenase Mo-binding subunit
VTFVLGQAALKAAAKLKMLLAERAAEILGVSSGKVVLKGGRLSAGRGGSRALSLAEVAKAAAARNQPIEVQSYHAETETPPEGVFAACVAEVYVDVATGQSICASWIRFMMPRRSSTPWATRGKSMVVLSRGWVTF